MIKCKENKPKKIYDIKKNLFEYKKIKTFQMMIVWICEIVIWYENPTWQLLKYLQNFKI